MTVTIRRPCIGPVYEIDLNDAELARSLCCLCRPFASVRHGEEAESGEGAVRVTVKRYGGAYTVVTEDGEYETDDPIQEIENLMYLQTTVDGRYYALHAAAVGWKGKAYILSGVTEAGKTTLCTYLIQKGLRYITDDCVLIDRESLAVRPYAKSLHLRSGGMDVLRREGITLADCTAVGKGTRMRHVYMPLSDSTELYSIGGVFFIERSDHHNGIRRIETVRGIELLLKNALIYERTSPGLLAMHSRIAAAGCMRVVYADMGYVLRLITDGDA